MPQGIIKRKDIQGDKVIIEGGTDGTHIGNVGDKLKVTSTPGGGAIDNFYIRAALGQISGVTVMGIQGHNPSVAPSGEDLVTLGGTYNWPTSAAILDIVSDDADDTLAGTGARTLLIEGLDASYNEIQETVNLNGTTTVNTLQSYLRVNRTTMVACGSTGENQGEITVKNGSDTVSAITEGVGISQDAIFTIPADKVGLFSEAFVVSETNGLEIRTITHMGGCTLIPVIIDMGEPVFNFTPRQPLVLQEKTDFKIFVDPNSGSKSVSAIINLILVDV